MCLGPLGMFFFFIFKLSSILFYLVHITNDNAQCTTDMMVTTDNPMNNMMNDTMQWGVTGDQREWKQSPKHVI